VAQRSAGSRQKLTHGCPCSGRVVASIEGEWQEDLGYTDSQPGDDLPVASHRERASHSRLDAREPADWVSELGEDRERYAYPPPLNDCGFFEDYFDGRPEAVATFWRVMNRRLSAAA